ncbi:hypothetical protein O6H91_Y403400 [Diphasiastrum complanatum]|nr:hypothetical protein O6H91_Y403400 [Diphasiastrum complanatum]
MDSSLLSLRTDVGPSQINLPNGTCRDDPNDLTSTHDCTAHSVLFTPGTNTIRPLTISTDTWCSSGQFFPNGTLVQTGGDFDGNLKIRYFSPCVRSGTCDWVEATDQQLQEGRWYATNHLLPDGRQIIVGGRGVYTTEFIPANGQAPTQLPFLHQTDDFQHDNYYPFVHLIPDGNLFIFANRDSILYNYITNTVVRQFDTIPGEPRNYPSAGSSVLLPLTASDDFQSASVLVCGGAQFGAFANFPLAFAVASQTCGRIDVITPNTTWEMETMPMPRTMGDMVLLPSGDVLIINGAQNGCSGWGFANNASLSPVLYQPNGLAGQRFTTLTATTIARVYHSTANLLPDARVLVAGSNTHQFYTFSGDFPTELRLEAFYPPYLSPSFAADKPRLFNPLTSVRYNTSFRLQVTIQNPPQLNMEVNMVSAPFTTHSFSQGQRLLKLKVVSQAFITATNRYIISAIAPPNPVVAPPAYYMVFVVNEGSPSGAAWIRVSH